MPLPPLSNIKMPGNVDNKRVVMANRKFNKSKFNNESDDDDDDHKIDNILKDIPSLSKTLSKIKKPNTTKSSNHKSEYKTEYKPKHKQKHNKYSDDDDNDDESDSDGDSDNNSDTRSKSTKSTKSDDISDSDSSSSSKASSSKSNERLKDKHKQLTKFGFLKETENMRVNNNIKHLLGESTNKYGGDDDLKTRINTIQTRHDIISRIEELKECIDDPIIIKSLPEINDQTTSEVLIDTINALEYKYESMNNIDIAKTASDFFTGFLEDVFNGKRAIVQNIDLRGISLKVSRHLNKRKLHVDYMVREVKKAYGIGSGMEFMIHFLSMCYITNKENKIEQQRTETMKNRHAMSLASKNFLDKIQ